MKRCLIALSWFWMSVLTCSASSFAISNQLSLCNQEKVASTPFGLSTPCSATQDTPGGFSVDGTAQGLADFISLGALVDFSVTLPAGTSTQNGPNGISTVTATDTISVNSGSIAAGFLLIPVALHGIGTSIDQNLVPSALAFITLNDSTGEIARTTLLTSGVGSILVPLTSGSTLTMSRYLQVVCGAFAFSGPITEHCTADYSHTFGLLPFQVFDSSMNLIPTATVTGDTGFAYEVASGVPEPATLAMTILGLALVVVSAVKCQGHTRLTTRSEAEPR
jgi:hypothetical protein